MSPPPLCCVAPRGPGAGSDAPRPGRGPAPTRQVAFRTCLSRGPPGVGGSYVVPCHWGDPAEPRPRAGARPSPSAKLKPGIVHCNPSDTAPCQGPRAKCGSLQKPHQSPWRRSEQPRRPHHDHDGPRPPRSGFVLQRAPWLTLAPGAGDVNAAHNATTWRAVTVQTMHTVGRMTARAFGRSRG